EYLRNLDRPAQHETVLVAHERVLQHRSAGERIVQRVELRVTEELEQRAVIGVRAGLRRDVHLARSSSELGRIPARRHLELLAKTDRGKEQVAVKVVVRVLDAIEGEVIELAPLPGDADVLRRPLPALNADLLAGATEAVRNIRGQSDELEKVAPVQRQVLYALVLD